MVWKEIRGLFTRPRFLLTSRPMAAARAHRTLIFGTKGALNGIDGAIDRVIVCMSILHGSLYSMNAKLAQVKLTFDCAHAVFTLLGKPLR